MSRVVPAVQCGATSLATDQLRALLPRGTREAFANCKRLVPNFVQKEIHGVKIYQQIFILIIFKITFFFFTECYRFEILRVISTTVTDITPAKIATKINRNKNKKI